VSALVKDIDLGLLDRRADARAVDADKVRAIASSMVDVGQINPIRVRQKEGGRFEIVAGVHRVEACRSLGLAEVDALIVESGDLFAELAMIDENLCRADLGPADRARQMARRKAIYEELHPEVQHGGARSEPASRQVGDLNQPAPPQAERFTADTARQTGTSERTVQREAERGEKISPDVLELIRGTDLDTGTYLDGLKRFAPDRQRMMVERDLEALRLREVNGARAIAPRRQEPADSLDFFPTPPWATRALLEDVLLAVFGESIEGLQVWEPACGEGHISGVLEEYGAKVAATDIFDYSLDGRSPPGWRGTTDFLDPDQGGSPDWIITNTPFGPVALEMALKALRLTKRGLALFVRQQWLETPGRYERLFKDQPPAIYAQFVERVPLHKGRWEPEGDTLTAYCWLVWFPGRAAAGTRMIWIPPGRREVRSRVDDVERFTAHPVMPVSRHGAEEAAAGGDCPDSPAAETVTGGATQPAAATGEDDPSASPVDPAFALYRQLVAADQHRGQHSKATAEPILRAAYACEPVIPTKTIAADIGAPIGSVLGWASRLDLTRLDRRGGPGGIGRPKQEAANALDR